MRMEVTKEMYCDRYLYLRRWTAIAFRVLSEKQNSTREEVTIAESVLQERESYDTDVVRCCPYVNKSQTYVE